MHGYFVHLAYWGTHYRRGWQRQSDGTPSVQATIEAALTRVQGEPVDPMKGGQALIHKIAKAMAEQP